jgi:capsular exopolysaccharide synthesis family protein
MTIEDAINRAKLLGQGRLQKLKIADEARRQLTEPKVPMQPDHGSARQGSEPAVQFEPLRAVAISAAACEQHRVLLSESQLRAFPQADAAYRLLRSKVQHRLKRHSWFSLAIASPNSDDGKTITTLNLAISIAREKQRPVYVLDLDMRNPCILDLLGIQDARPLPEYFLSQAKPDDVLVETSLQNLIVAGALSATEGASELLAGPRFEELLAHIRRRSPNACVLVDLPPLNVTDEALLIGPRVDAFLMVVSEGKTERKDLARALSMLSEFTVAGVVVNRSSESRTTEYSKYLA